MANKRVYRKLPRWEERISSAWYAPEIDRETRLRIRLAVAAYAYEILNDNIMSDGDFDKLSQEVNLSIKTRRADLDHFFKNHFNPSTGSWIHQHPDLSKIAIIANRIIKERNSLIHSSNEDKGYDSGTTLDKTTKEEVDNRAT